jgi:hypothetical protein
MPERDFEILYRATPEHRRGNSNLPGHFVYPVTRLEGHADYRDRQRKACETFYPGFDPAHVHAAVCDIGGRLSCNKWSWLDYGIPNEYNPVREFIAPYEQLSRAEGMKGSNQVALGFQTLQQQEAIDMGKTPSLTPRPGAGTPTVIINNGTRAVKEVRKGVLGLGGK